MKEIIKMLTVLTLICGVCGFLLALVKSKTSDRVEEQILLNVKGPAVEKVLAGSTNKLIKDRKEIELGDKKMNVFVGKKDGSPWAIAFEVSGTGFGGDIGVMLGFNLKSDVLTGIGITTHKETPGLGSKVTEDGFTSGFKGKGAGDILKIKNEGGIIDAVTGATVSSKGVCSAVREGVKLLKDIKSKVEQ